MNNLIDNARELRPACDERTARLYWYPDTVYRPPSRRGRLAEAPGRVARWLFRHSGLLLWVAITFVGFVLLGEVAGYLAWRLLRAGRDWGEVLCTAGALAGLLAWTGCWTGWLIAMMEWER